MKRYILPLLLLICESVILICFCNTLGLSGITAFKSLVVYILFIIVFDHLKITSKLIWDEMRMLFKADTCFFVVMILESKSVNDVLYYLIIALFMYCIALFLNRSLRILFRDFLARRTLIIGTGTEAERIGRISNYNRFALTKVIGYVKFDNDEVNKDLMKRYNEEFDFNLYNDIEIENIIEKEKIEQVIISLPEKSKEKINSLTMRLNNKVEIIKYVPEVDITITFDSKIQDFDGILLIASTQGSIGFFGKIIKRLIDIISAIVGILILIPLSALVRYKNHKSGDFDPIFFKQERIGLNGDHITIYKFRTMIPDAETVLEELMEQDANIRDEYLKNKKLINDPRITKAGNFLRKTSLDEFPQFINVLKGEMSLVGPRPYLPREKKDMGFYYDSIIKSKPGITGMWQANGRSDVGFIDRCKFDDYYYKNWTIGLDMIIIYKTIRSVIYGKGAL